MIRVSYKGATYEHPGWDSPADFHGFIGRHPEALDAPLLRLAPRIFATQRDMQATGKDAAAAAYGAVLASAAEVLDILQGRPSSAMYGALLDDKLVALVRDVSADLTVDGAPAGTSKTWHRANDPWGGHVVSLLVVWQAQGFPGPGTSDEAAGAAEE